jgi:hypothetical protein
MFELTDQQLKRQDFVDNMIFQLINELNTSPTKVDWDIEMISEVRDRIQNWLADKCNVDEMSFYPFIEE